MEKILVIDDEQGITNLVSRALEKKGYSVTAYSSANDVNLANINNFNLILLDIMMPDMDGFQFCKKIRDITDCPILFLSAKVLEQDIVYGLSVGADDYITKPFSIKELCARVDAHLRREQRQHHNTLYISGITFDLSEKTVYVEKEKVLFTKSEYAICEYLALNRGHVFTKEQIYEQVFDCEKDSDSITIAVHIKNIRAKLLVYNKEVITTVWGIGYKWA